MIDGVSWAAGEIVGFMIVATLVGLAIGWIFGRWLQRRSIAEEYQAEVNVQSELARKAEHRLVESNATLDKLQEQLRAESEKVGELEAQLGASQQTVSDLAVELAAAGGSDSAFARVKDDLATARSEVAQRQGEFRVLQERLRGRDETVRDLESKLAEAREQAAAASDLERRLLDAQMELVSAHETSKHVGELRSQLEAAETARTEMEQRFREISDNTSRIEAREAEAGASRATAADLEPKPPEMPTPELTKDEAQSRIGEVAERTAGGKPPADDDLKRIHGIGPKLERLLKEMGISSFRQIANFTSEDVAVVTGALDAFKGRIERDDWMSSAAEQHIEKYGEPA